KPLVGKEMTMRYQEKIDVPPASDVNGSPRSESEEAATTHSIQSHELKLRIVGVTALDPDSMRGPIRARILLPLKLLQSLHVMQPTGMRDTTQATSKTPTYSTV